MSIETPVVMNGGTTHVNGNARTIGLPPSTAGSITVEIEGRLFVKTALTRSRFKRLADAEKAFHDATGEDENVRAAGELLSIAFEPVNGQRKTIGALIWDLWEKDLIELEQVSGLLEELMYGPPTQPVPETPPSAS